MDYFKISDLLVKTRGNQSEVARMLRINRCTLTRLMKQDEGRHIITQSDDGDYFMYTRIGENV
jgi:DNA-binding NtrC family response regulator